MHFGRKSFYTGVFNSEGIGLLGASCTLRIFIFLKLDEPNYGFQNDFGFAIVSVDDLDLGGNSKKCPGQ